jgi:hypothetical protein
MRLAAKELRSLRYVAKEDFQQKRRRGSTYAVPLNQVAELWEGRTGMLYKPIHSVPLVVMSFKS